MRAEGEEVFVSLSRSAWAGIQRYSTAVWSGDIQSTFEALQAQVRAGLNIGLSGVPWWTTDVGGFFGGDVNAPYFRELIVRWFQYGVFCPLFRLHGFRLSDETNWWETGGPNEVWSLRDHPRVTVLARAATALHYGAHAPGARRWDAAHAPVVLRLSGGRGLLGDRGSVHVRTRSARRAGAV
jgi:alpha-glucosidase (family GH31 glycosyl hydrolase)